MDFGQVELVEGVDEATGRRWRGWTLDGARHSLWLELEAGRVRVSLWRWGELVSSWASERPDFQTPRSLNARTPERAST